MIRDIGTYLHRTGIGIVFKKVGSETGVKFYAFVQSTKEQINGLLSFVLKYNGLASQTLISFCCVIQKFHIQDILGLAKVSHCAIEDKPRY